MYKLLKILAVCLAVSMIVGCYDSFLETRLDRAEQIINEHPDSAYSILNKVSFESISNSSQQARYALLLTMAQYKCDILPKNDSLINLALDYYKSGEYYQKSLIFKGAVMSELGHPIEAIEWYKKAETATPDDDYAQLGYINMRLGFIYRNAYMSNGYQIEKFKKSLACYNHTDDQKRQLVCLSEIGYSYYGIDKDSAYFYISSAIDYARQLNDSCSLFDNLQVLCRELRCDSLFEKSKELALYVIKEGSRYLSSYDIFHDVAYDYASLGMIDSAYFYFNRLPSENLSKRDSIVWLSTLRCIKNAEKKYDEVITIAQKTSDLAYDIYTIGQQQELYLTEKKYDNTLSELEKMKAQQHIAWLIVALLIMLIISGLVFVLAQKRKERILNYEQTITELRRNHVNEQMEFLKKLDEEKRNNPKDSLRIDRLKSIIENQIELIKRLLDKSAIAPESERFHKEFRKIISTARLEDSVWIDMRRFIDGIHNNIITNLSHRCPELTESELNFIGLLCCNFSMTEIMICMGYTNFRSTMNRRQFITKKLGIDIPLEQFLNELMQDSQKINKGITTL